MSDELMRQIKQSLEDEYTRGFEKGWCDGNVAAWSSMAEWAAECLAGLKTREPSPQDEAEEDSTAERFRPLETFAEDGTRQWVDRLTGKLPDAERRLTPAQQRAVDYVRENPGLTSRKLQGIGKGILYGLVRAGVLAKRGPQFYPAENA